MDTFLHDLRYSVRTLSRHPGLVVIAVVSLAVGIGVNTAIFSVLNTLVLRPLPVRDSDRTVVVYHAGPERADRGTSYPAFHRYAARTDLFDGVTAFTAARPLLLADGDRREPIYAQPVSADFFSMTRIDVRLGRAFGTAVDQSLADDFVAVVSHAFWQRRLASDPAVVGKTLVINNRPFTVTGVAAPGFTGLDPEASVDLWIPLTTWAHVMNESGRLTGDEHWLTTIARVKDGVTFEQAQAALSAVQQVPDEQPRIRPVQQLRAGQEMGDAVYLGLAGMVAGLLVLALACTNVANLLMARAAARQAEMSVRLALGASRTRVMRLWLTESLLLCVAAGAGSFVVAWWLTRVAVAFNPPALLGSEAGPVLPFDFTLDVRVFAFTLGLSILTALTVGLVSALQGSRPQVLRAMRSDRVTDRRFAPGLNVPSAVIALQMVLSVLLLVPCGLFVRSWLQGRAIDPGFSHAHVLLLPVSTRQPGMNVRKPAGFDALLAAHVARRPAVVAATLMDPVPLWFNRNATHIEGLDTRLAGARMRVGFSRIGTSYFDVLQIRLLRGRDFSRSDTSSSPPVAIVNETTARMLWPDTDAVGQRVREGNRIVEIVGVARDAKYVHLGETSTPWLYFPLAQEPTDNPSLSLAVRTTGDPRALQAAIEQDVKALVPTWPSFQFRTLDEGLELQRQLPRVAAALLGALGGFGFLLALIGVYGLMSYHVRQRRHEIGIYLALGAPLSSVVVLVIRQGMAVCIAGGAIGLLLTLAVARFIGSVLYGISGADPVTYLIVPLLLLCAALLACYLPARQATTVDPVEALRAD